MKRRCTYKQVTSGEVWGENLFSSAGWMLVPCDGRLHPAGIRSDGSYPRRDNLRRLINVRSVQILCEQRLECVTQEDRGDWKNQSSFCNWQWLVGLVIDRMRI